MLSSPAKGESFKAVKALLVQVTIQVSHPTNSMHCT